MRFPGSQHLVGILPSTGGSHAVSCNSLVKIYRKLEECVKWHLATEIAIMAHPFRNGLDAKRMPEGRDAGKGGGLLSWVIESIQKTDGTFWSRYLLLSV